jgi:hypothetical protein
MRPKIVTLNESQTADVPSGVAESVEILAPRDAMYRVKQLQAVVSADADATTNDHRIQAKSAAQVFAIEGASAFDSSIRFEKGHWQKADSIKRPAQSAAQVQQMQSLVATESAALQLRYANNTDVAQENNRSFVFVLEELTY